MTSSANSPEPTGASDEPSVKGDLQAELMRILWNMGAGTVEDVRSRLPEAHRGAYTTVQTVLNRLAERGLLERERRGRSLVYRPLMSEAQYLSSSLRRSLSAASAGARAAALAEIIGSLDTAELDELRQHSLSIDPRRRAR
jgi:predicted transcriptional regulator